MVSSLSLVAKLAVRPRPGGFRRALKCTAVAAVAVPPQPVQVACALVLPLRPVRHSLGPQSQSDPLLFDAADIETGSSKFTRPSLP